MVSVYDAQGVPFGMGSSVVIGPEELVTNCHVLKGGRSVSIRREKITHAASLLHPDAERDLCILRAKGLTAPAVKIAPLSALKVGQKVYAIGAPRGYELTLSDGLLSSLNKDERDRVVRLQTTAPISPGSSGGGLFNAQGQLVGITYLMRTDAQNLNFAIPAQWIAEVPARSAQAQQSYRNEIVAMAAPATTAASPPRPAVGPQGRQLTGAELASHFTHLGRVDVIAPSGATLRMQVRESGSLDVTNALSRSSSPGRYRVDVQANQVCLDLANPKFSAMQACYGVTEANGRFGHALRVKPLLLLIHEIAGGRGPRRLQPDWHWRQCGCSAGLRCLRYHVGVRFALRMPARRHLRRFSARSRRGTGLRFIAPSLHPRRAIAVITQSP
ncbi:S1C family serine protease [Cupriavidus sp.]|uniref:S1C family serine protease n=1 Tax=Cupriavidus sp. TaxID=1873897 RepID=UPI003D0E780F